MNSEAIQTVLSCYLLVQTVKNTRHTFILYRHMLDKIQACNIEVAQHIKNHPKDYSPTHGRLQYNPCNQRVNSQCDLHPDDPADWRYVAQIDALICFMAVAKVQFGSTYEGTTHLC